MKTFTLLVDIARSGGPARKITYLAGDYVILLDWICAYDCTANSNTFTGDLSGDPKAPTLDLQMSTRRRGHRFRIRAQFHYLPSCGFVLTTATVQNAAKHNGTRRTVTSMLDLVNIIQRGESEWGRS
ncbi:hypothetical protein GCM10023085_44810 [Actinomadura viridis]|uniref:Uncharacterized protein n=1 Tax=Actinomadura viridis TaxID=58110 RepID=A0A931DNF8_9ACTN|nr:hypothetical protein [Actinomadura viridis]MBG6089843.1 hypothetical protein [Actinomadura viridis]